MIFTEVLLLQTILQANCRHIKVKKCPDHILEKKTTYPAQAGWSGQVADKNEVSGTPQLPLPIV